MPTSSIGVLGDLGLLQLIVGGGIGVRGVLVARVRDGVNMVEGASESHVEDRASLLIPACTPCLI
jgi:hypothetical protein